MLLRLVNKLWTERYKLSKLNAGNNAVLDVPNVLLSTIIGTLQNSNKMSTATEGRGKTFFGLPVASDVSKVNVATYLLGCMASVMFLVFLNASQVLHSAAY